jgi:hypothetical protein
VRERVRGERERGEVGKWGELWRVRWNDATSHAPSPGVQTKPRFVPPRGWPRENARISGIRWAYVEGALTRMRAKKMRELRNPINRLLAPQAWLDSSQATNRALPDKHPLLTFICSDHLLTPIAAAAVLAFSTSLDRCGVLASRVNNIKLPHLGHTWQVSTTFLIFC